jgi:octopine/nopaline transport system permease protein
VLSLLTWGATGWGDELVYGAVITILAGLCSYIFGLALATLFASFKLSNSFVLRSIAVAYTTVTRGVPELLVVYFIYFGSASLVGSLAKNVFGHSGYIELPLFVVGVLCLSASSGAYSTEVIYGAVLAVPTGQLDAARAVGMTPFTRFRRILFPQVVRYALSGLSNVWLFTLKQTSLLSVIGLAEVLREANLATGATQQPFTFYGCALLIYLFLAWFSNRAFLRAESWANRGFK